MINEGGFMMEKSMKFIYIHFCEVSFRQLKSIVACAMIGLCVFLLTSCSADPYSPKALQNAEKSLGPHHPEFAKLLISAAESQRDKYDRALPLYQKALSIIDDGFFGPPDPEILKVTLEGFAELHQDHGHLEAALPLVERILLVDFTSPAENIFKEDKQYYELIVEKKLSMLEQEGVNVTKIDNVIRDLAYPYKKQGVKILKSLILYENREECSVTNLNKMIALFERSCSIEQKTGTSVCLHGLAVLHEIQGVKANDLPAATLDRHAETNIIYEDYNFFRWDKELKEKIAFLQGQDSDSARFDLSKAYDDLASNYESRIEQLIERAMEYGAWEGWLSQVHELQNMSYYFRAMSCPERYPEPTQPGCLEKIYKGMPLPGSDEMAIH
jgi:tetratricopeptide (TPR) repeat protein